MSHFIECFPERRYGECYYAECRYAECHYAECRSAQATADDKFETGNS
jgi:hypothetical protein